MGARGAIALFLLIVQVPQGFYNQKLNKNHPLLEVQGRPGLTQLDGARGPSVCTLPFHLSPCLAHRMWHLMGPGSPSLVGPTRACQGSACQAQRVCDLTLCSWLGGLHVPLMEKEVGAQEGQ